VSALVTFITVPLAFGFAYALHALVHALQAAVSRHHPGAAAGAQSLLSAISLIYWFGNQGVLKGWMHGLGHSTRSMARRASWWPNALRSFRTR
jgi:iron(III) transport system permease protein